MLRRACERGRWRAARDVVSAGAVACAACTSGGPVRGGPTPATTADARIARVSLGIVPTAALSATGAWTLTDHSGRVVASGGARDRIALSSARTVLRLTDQRGSTRDLGAPVALVVASKEGAIVNDRRYRGELAFTPADSGVHIINRVPLEAYLRGVVPREIGIRALGERAAVEAQAVAARSYAFTRLANASRAYDLAATTSDQVYGGMDAENAVADAAVAATEGLVLQYAGRVVSAPYHSTCGGSTAEPAEVWRSRSEPFLQRVSDRIPGSDRYYCDIAPRFRWERTWRADTLTAIVGRYLRNYSSVAAGPLGTVRGISVDGRTASGRVAAILIETDGGQHRVQANDIRYVLRSSGGELLNSTYFSPEVVPTTDGRLARLTIRGLGYGHGVGMCQWGAIGRARAGQDFRTILRTYFPGTSVARAY